MAGESKSALRESPGCAPLELGRHPLTRRRILSGQQYVDGILKGDRSILAQAITLIESSRAMDRELAEQIVEECLPSSGKSLRVGITGVPGAGKSTVVEALGRYLTSECAEKIAVLAIDPSSQLSGGSILGDKTRMTSLASSEMAFIRPTPSRGAYGGVAHHTREAILLCEAAGYQTIFVETVGVGQSEVAVHDMVDTVVLILLAGAGDELQGIKRGVMEWANVLVVNKAEAPNQEATERAITELKNALHLFPISSTGWLPRTLACSALTGQGITELWTVIQEHVSTTRASGWFDRTRKEQTRRWMHEAVEQGLKQKFKAHPEIRNRMEDVEQDVLEGRITPVHGARTLIDLFSARARC